MFMLRPINHSFRHEEQHQKIRILFFFFSSSFVVIIRMCISCLLVGNGVGINREREEEGEQEQDQDGETIKIPRALIQLK